MSSLVIDLRRKFYEVQEYIRFHLFKATHEMHLIRLNKLLRLPPFDTLILDHENYTAKSFWYTITYSG